MLDSRPRQNVGISILFSYAHEDEGLREKLESHLSQLKRDGLIEAWHDRRIGAGHDWQKEIDDRLSTCQVILLLLSADFLASEYCWGVEVKRALERHGSGMARVIPVILRPVDWERSPLAQLQALPRDGKPVTTWKDCDEALLDVALGIRAAVVELAATIECTESSTAAEQSKHSWPMPSATHGGSRRSAQSEFDDPTAGDRDGHTTVLEIRMTGDFDDVVQVKAAVLKTLRKISGDSSLTIKTLRPGSVVMILEGDLAALRRVKSMIEHGELNIIEGFVIRNATWVEQPPASSKSAQKSPAFRLGDIVDDFCVRCKRIMNHAVVSVLNSEPAKVRCRTCHSDHDYRHEQPPPSKVAARKQALFNEVLKRVNPDDYQSVTEKTSKPKAKGRNRK
jgi:TIR domain